MTASVYFKNGNLAHPVLLKCCNRRFNMMNSAASRLEGAALPCRTERRGDSHSNNENKIPVTRRITV